jgi:exonuclease III
MTTRIHRPLKITAFNANGVFKHRYELSKQLQDLHVDVALFSETHLKPHERSYIPKYYPYRIDRHPERKGGTAITVRKGIPHRQVDLVFQWTRQESAYQSVTTKCFLQLFINLQIVPGVTNITELLGFRNKCVLRRERQILRLCMRGHWT